MVLIIVCSAVVLLALSIVTVWLLRRACGHSDVVYGDLCPVCLLVVGSPRPPQVPAWVLALTMAIAGMALAAVLWLLGQPLVAAAAGGLLFAALVGVIYFVLWVLGQEPSREH